MSVERALTRFRRRQAEQLTASAHIDRPLGPPAWDPESQATVTPVSRAYANRRCKVTSLEAEGTDRTTGQSEARFVGHLIKFDPDTDVRPGDLVTVVSSRHNPLDVGITYRVTDIDRREWQIARRCIVEEVVVPMRWEAP